MHHQTEDPSLHTCESGFNKLDASIFPSDKASFIQYVRKIFRKIMGKKC